MWERNKEGKVNKCFNYNYLINKNNNNVNSGIKLIPFLSVCLWQNSSSSDFNTLLCLICLLYFLNISL